MIVEKNMIRNVLLALMFMQTAGCVGTIIGATTDAVIEVAKVPFKVAGAVVDVVTPDKD